MTTKDPTTPQDEPRPLIEELMARRRYWDQFEADLEQYLREGGEDDDDDDDYERYPPHDDSGSEPGEVMGFEPAPPAPSTNMDDIPF